MRIFAIHLVQVTSVLGYCFLRFVNDGIVSFTCLTNNLLPVCEPSIGHYFIPRYQVVKESTIINNVFITWTAALRPINKWFSKSCWYYFSWQPHKFPQFLNYDRYPYIYNFRSTILMQNVNMFITFTIVLEKHIFYYLKYSQHIILHCLLYISQLWWLV